MTYPKVKDPIQQLIEDITKQGKEDDIIVKAMTKELRAFGIDYEMIQDVKATEFPQYKMPYKFNF